MGAGSISTAVARREEGGILNAPPRQRSDFFSHYELKLLIIPSPTGHTRRPPATEIACNALSHGARCMDALDQWPGPSSSNLTDGLSQTVSTCNINQLLVPVCSDQPRVSNDGKKAKAAAHTLTSVNYKYTHELPMMSKSVKKCKTPTKERA